MTEARQTNPRVSRITSLFTCLAFAWLSLSPALLLADALEDAQRLLDSGDTEQALVLLEGFASQLPANERPTVWHTTFSGPAMEKVRLGKRYGYLISGLQSRQSPPHRGVTNTRVADESNLKGQPVWQGSCIDLKTGKVLWTYALPYQARAAIHPDDDALWVWTRHEVSPIFRISSDGEIERKGTIQQHRHADSNANGLRIGKVHLWDLQDTRKLLPKRIEYNLDEDTLEEVVASELLSPNGLNKLAIALHQSPSDVTTYVQLVPASVRDIQEPIWKLDTRGYASDPPFWVGQDVVALSGGPRGHGFVYRLSGTTGAVRWVTALPEPIYSAKHAQKSNGTYGDHGSNTAGLVADCLPIAGVYGGLFLLDWETGIIQYRHEIGQPLIAPVHQTEDGLVIIAGYQGIRASHPDRLTEHLSDDAPFIKQARLRVRAMMALERSVDAMSYCSQLTSEAPSEPALWQLRSEVYLANDHPVEADSAQSIAMKLTGQRESLRLRESLGLIDRLPTAAIKAPIVSTGRIVLVGGQDGTVISYDTGSQSIIETTQHPAGIEDFWWEDAKLMAKTADRHTLPVRQFTIAPDLEEDDPLLRQKNPKGAPSEWTRATIANNWFIHHGDVYIRPDKNGGSKAYNPETDEVTIYPPLLGGVTHFRVTKTPGGWFAFGPQSHGVYEVDEPTLRPKRMLIDSGFRIKDEPRSSPNSARMIAGGPDTLAAVFSGFPKDRLQVWTYDGKTCQRDVETRMPRFYKYSPERLTRLSNGYLYCGAELVFVPDDPEAPVKRFSPYLLQINMLHPNEQADWGFMAPRYVDNNLLVVAHNHGGLFVFDLDRMCGTGED